MQMELNKRNTLVEFLSRHSIHIPFITETHLIEQDKFKIPGYKVYWNDQTKTAGGVALLV
jgi:hypothetical protein